jgi:hypothetical protein
MQPVSGGHHVPELGQGQMSLGGKTETPHLPPIGKSLGDTVSHKPISEEEQIALAAAQAKEMSNKPQFIARLTAGILLSPLIPGEPMVTAIGNRIANEAMKKLQEESKKLNEKKWG